MMTLAGGRILPMRMFVTLFALSGDKAPHASRAGKDFLERLSHTSGKMNQFHKIFFHFSHGILLGKCLFLARNRREAVFGLKERQDSSSI